ncbi:TPM domain-containing protein [Pyxidicoccus sp. MSG2]|uniref:TPM domain-containing protein n=1 Tax=Pyxidicoccus sp. MSG2 TaxID=2996790 RepID=UPI00226DD2C3|nr:TPM domain-containing protein [Pyxidicoccus sp. MSG2]MCY1019077.1 TPM domain-containing protein [Pyxidicoccus sp. MSG2]
MLKSLLLLLLPVFLLGATPVVDRPVVDTSGRLSPADKEAVATELVRLREETGAQMAVLMVDTTGGVPIEDYALQVAAAWKGGGRGQDNGLLLVLAVNDRRQRLEVGYGLEEHLPDDAVRTLLDAQGPLLRQGDYRGALLAVVQGVRLRLPNADGVVENQVPSTAPKAGEAFVGLLVGGLLMGMLLGQCVGAWRKRLGTVKLAWAVGALVVLPLGTITLATWSSQHPTVHFLGTFVIFATVFCLLTLVGIHASRVLAFLLGGIQLLTGLFIGTMMPSPGVLDMLGLTVFTSACISFVPFLVWAFIWGVNRADRSGSSSSSGDSSPSSWSGASSPSSWSDSSSSSSSWSDSSSSDSSSSSSSSSDSSWSGGGGDFGGGGSNSSW